MNEFNAEFARKLAEIQRDFKKIADSGGYAVVVHPDEFEAFKRGY